MLAVHDGFDGLAHGMVNICTELIIVVNSPHGGQILLALKEKRFEPIIEPSLCRLSLLAGLGWLGGLEKEAPILAQNGELFQHIAIVVLCII